MSFSYQNFIEKNQSILDVFSKIWTPKRLERDREILSLKDIHCNHPFLKIYHQSFLSGECHLVKAQDSFTASSFLSILSGHFSMQKGKIFFHQQDITHDHLLQRTQKGIRFLPEKIPFFDSYSMIDHLDFAAELSESYNDFHRDFLKDFLGLFFQLENCDKKVSNLSLESRKIMELCSIFLGSYEIFLLDCPFKFLTKKNLLCMQYLLYFWLEKTNGLILLTDSDESFFVSGPNTLDFLPIDLLHYSSGLKKV